MFGDGTGNQQYLFIFSQVHLGFRLAEFESICSLFNIAYDRSSLETKVSFNHLEDLMVIEKNMGIV